MSTEVEEREGRQRNKLDRVHKRWKGRGSVRQYSDEEIGTALAVLDHYSGNALRTSRELGIPRSTIRLWDNSRQELSPTAANVCQRKKEEFAQLSDEAAEWIITSITPKDIRNASLYQKATSYGIFRDKSAQDRGEAGVVVQHRQDPHALWLKTLEVALDAARLAGASISREEAIRQIVEWKPEAAQYLLPEGKSEDVKQS